MKQIAEGFVKRYMNQSLWSIHVAFVILVICLIFSIPYGLFVIIPFLLVGLISYVFFRSYSRKWLGEQVRPQPSEKERLIGNDAIVIQQEETIHFLDPKGETIGSMKKRGESGYCFYNDAEFPIYIARKKASHRLLLMIENHHQQEHAVYNESGMASFFYHSGKLKFHNQTLSIKRKHHQSFCFVLESGLEVATIQKGWMPTEWQKRFSANTPTVQFHSSVDEEQKKILMLLIGIFMVRSI